MKNAVGILGGVGPLATVYFMDMLIKMTEAEKDQDHIDMLVSNHSTIPDRTAYIVGTSDVSPEPAMVADAEMLQNAGCQFIVIPCNTAHFFFEEIEASVEIPVLNIIKETIAYAVEKVSHCGCTKPAEAGVKLGILATEGTVSSGTYSWYGNPMGVTCIAPDEEYQQKVNEIIYGKVKAGQPVTLEEMGELVEHMRAKGCDAVIMGCTELSVAYKDLGLGEIYPDVIDSLTVLARQTILKCGKKLRCE